MANGDWGEVLQFVPKHYFCNPKKEIWLRKLRKRLLSKSCNRGVVERFIAPVLKTGDPSRGPGVRIPPPLLSISQAKSKPRKSYDFGAFAFQTIHLKSRFIDLLVPFGAIDLLKKLVAPVNVSAHQMK